MIIMFIMHTSLDRPAKTESMLSRVTEWPFTLRMVSPGDGEVHA